MPIVSRNATSNVRPSIIDAEPLSRALPRIGKPTGGKAEAKWVRMVATGICDASDCRRDLGSRQRGGRKRVRGGGPPIRKRRQMRRFPRLRGRRRPVHGVGASSARMPPSSLWCCCRNRNSRHGSPPSTSNRRGGPGRSCRSSRICHAGYRMPRLANSRPRSHAASASAGRPPRTCREAQLCRRCSAYRGRKADLLFTAAPRERAAANASVKASSWRRARPTRSCLVPDDCRRRPAAMSLRHALCVIGVRAIRVGRMSPSPERQGARDTRLSSPIESGAGRNQRGHFDGLVALDSGR